MQSLFEYMRARYHVATSSGRSVPVSEQGLILAFVAFCEEELTKNPIVALVNPTGRDIAQAVLMGNNVLLSLEPTTNRLWTPAPDQPQQDQPRQEPSTGMPAPSWTFPVFPAKPAQPEQKTTQPSPPPAPSWTTYSGLPVQPVVPTSTSGGMPTYTVGGPARQSDPVLTPQFSIQAPPTQFVTQASDPVLTPQFPPQVVTDPTSPASYYQPRPQQVYPPRPGEKPADPPFASFSITGGHG